MKKILMAFTVAGMALVASAQNKAGYENVSGNKYEVFTNKFGDNWFFSLGGGAEFLLGNSDNSGSLGDHISPTLNFSVGKWFTPGLGLRLQYSGLQARGLTKDALNGYVDGTSDVAGYYKQKFNYMNLHGDVLFNLSALIGGYNPDRVYEITPYVGAGFTHVYSSPQSEALAVNAGIINTFRVSPALDINIELSMMGVENKFDGERGGKPDLDGVAAITAGITYRFPQREFRKPVAARQVISEGELEVIRGKLRDLSTENLELKEAVAIAAATPAPVIEAVTIKAPDIAPRSVFFNIGSSKVSPQELVNLGFLADQMKEFPELNFKLTGYADSKTGTPEGNKKLSLKRAEAVIDALVGTYKIDRNRLSADSVGGVELYDKEYLNRMVLIEVVK